mgnify:CR=1 FL=1
MEVDVSSTELVRGLGDVLARVRYRRDSFVVRKNGRVIARIVPADAQAGATVREALGAWVASGPPDRAFADDLARVNSADAPAGNPWES